MSQRNGESYTKSAISASLIVGFCILSAVAVVVMVGTMYRLCRTQRDPTGPAELDGGANGWNPNKRTVAQLERMREVRLINRMHTWDRLKEEQREDNRQRQEQRSKRWMQRTNRKNPSSSALAGLDTASQSGIVRSCYDIAEDEHDELLNADVCPDNPYRQQLRTMRYQQQGWDEPGERATQVSSHPSLSDAYAVSRSVSAPATNFSRRDFEPMPSVSQSSFRVNIQSERDVEAEAEEIELSSLSREPDGKYLQPPAPTYFPRSSSIYSQDDLLPMTHLQYVHSSSEYGREGPFGVDDDNSRHGRRRHEPDEEK